MTMVRGVDGCKGGWLVLAENLTSGQVSAHVFARCDGFLLDSSATVTTIDIPIGLPESEPRACDLAARRLLGPRSSSVFPAPVRAALGPGSYEAACEASESACGKRLTKQTWAILPKIREVDDALRRSEGLLERVHEIHPEICFYFLNGKRPMAYSKRSGFGFVERYQLLEEFFANSADRIRARISGNAVADDDILDALAALWTARRIHEGAAVRVPDGPPARDTQGLPMQMLA